MSDQLARLQRNETDYHRGHLSRADCGVELARINQAILAKVAELSAGRDGTADRRT